MSDPQGDEGETAANANADVGHECDGGQYLDGRRGRAVHQCPGLDGAQEQVLGDVLRFEEALAHALVG